MTPAAGTDTCPNCAGGAGDSRFDRTLCACGRMHFYCQRCGNQLEPCDPVAGEEIVTFEGTYEERRVVGYCKVCRADRPAMLVSPQGIAHHVSGYSDRTDCGKDATGTRWWWRD